jgi:hypothetical protein
MTYRPSAHHRPTITERRRADARAQRDLVRFATLVIDTTTRERPSPTTGETLYRAHADRS